MKLARGTVQAEATGRLTTLLDELPSRYVRFGTDVLVYADDADYARVAARAQEQDLHLEEIGSANRDHMFLVTQVGGVFQLLHPDVKVLYDGGRFLVVELSSQKVDELVAFEEIHFDADFSIEPLEDDTTVYEAQAVGTGRVARVPWVQTLVDAVSAAEFHAMLSHVVSVPTRFSSSAHFDDVFEWARDRFDAFGYTTAVQSITFGEETSRNLVAERVGRGAGPRQLLIVGAHLDSINILGGPDAPAPGADDNGSGSAGVLEMARVFKDHAATHDVRFVLFGAEERGLFGSRRYAESLTAEDRQRLKGVWVMDMIATLNRPSAPPGVLLEGAEVSRSLIDDLVSAATTYTGLEVQTRMRPCCSDHVPFIDQSLPAVLTIERADEANRRVHTVDDTLAHIDTGLATAILRMNVAAVATALGNEGETVMRDDTAPLMALLATTVAEELQRRQLSGRYEYGGGVTTRESAGDAGSSAAARMATAANPMYPTSGPIYLADMAEGAGTAREGGQREALRFTLHIDIDGPYPLNVVSGVVVQDMAVSSGGPQREQFIGRVTSNTVTSGTRKLVVEDFALRWHEGAGDASVVDRLEIELPTSFPLAPAVEVSFVAAGTGSRRGPYIVHQTAPYFREVEVEVDREANAADAEPYNTFTHPDRPAGVVEEELTLESTFARAGIRVSRATGGNIIDTSAAGSDSRWTDQELHDAMERNWSHFANRPQWKAWIFLAERHVKAGLGGIMFDAGMNAPGGVDRQGTAVFTKNAFFHSPEGGYAKANPPADAAVKRELYFNLIHEFLHCFNVYHSFAKTLGSPWAAPSWMPVRSNPQALTFSNYPDQAAPFPTTKHSAKWFYDQFPFRFDDSEHLYLRHAPAEFVEMGNAAWSQSHGRVAEVDLDRRLQLQIEPYKDVVELGEPVFVTLVLHNVGEEDVLVHASLDPAESGFVEVAITRPHGERIPHLPVSQTRSEIELAPLGNFELNLDERRQTLDLTAGKLGFPFTEAGMYRIEASYTNTHGGSAAAVARIYVRPPTDYDNVQAVSELFDARVGRALLVGGTRVMEDVNDKLGHVAGRVGQEHPVSFYLSYVRGLPFSRSFKVLQPDRGRVHVHDPDERIVDETLGRITRDADAALARMGEELYSRAVVGRGDFLVAAERTDEAMTLVDTTLDVLQRRQDAGVAGGRATGREALSTLRDFKRRVQEIG